MENSDAALFSSYDGVTVAFITAVQLSDGTSNNGHTFTSLRDGHSGRGICPSDILAEKKLMHLAFRVLIQLDVYFISGVQCSTKRGECPVYFKMSPGTIPLQTVGYSFFNQELTPRVFTFLNLYKGHF